MNTMPVEKGFVYLFRISGSNVYKIGSSTDPARRMKTLQAERVQQLECEAMIYYADCRNMEIEWQNQYQDYRILGEWFLLPLEAVEYFKSFSAPALPETFLSSEVQR